jgi:DNA-binding XRE family transcriptional regulator
MVPLDRGRRAPALMMRIRKIPARTWIHCNFFTKPKIKLTVQRPKIVPDGYPLRPKTLGDRIKKKRMDMGLFQKDVARIIGVSTDTITNWEKGWTEPGRRNICKIEPFLSVKE